MSLLHTFDSFVDCKSKRKCQHCSKRHNTLLHFQTQTVSDNLTKNDSKEVTQNDSLKSPDLEQGSTNEISTNSKLTISDKNVEEKTAITNAQSEHILFF